jgi:hypothetical protein
MSTPDQKAVKKVLQLHKPVAHSSRAYCDECLRDDGTGSWESVPYPCSTVRVITEALKE